MSRRLLLRAALSACLLGALVCTAFAAAAPRRSATAHATAPRGTRAAARHGRTTPSRQAAEPGQSAASTAPADSSRAAWTQARALADAGRHEEALSVLRDALARDPQNTDLRWLEASVTGWNGEHAEAVHRFERLVADQPELEKDVRGDLAGERLAAGDAAGALRDLDLRVAEQPNDRDARMNRAQALVRLERMKEALAAYDALLREAPDDADVMMERARVLVWLGRNGDAAATYAAVLARQPENRRARLGLAMNENWQGYHRRAAARLESLATDPEPDPEVWKTLAFARYWNGEPDRAGAALDEYLTREPDDAEALDLSRRLRAEQSPSLTAVVAHADDSDRLRIRTTRMELRLPLPHQNTAELSWQRDRVRDDGGEHKPFRFGLGLETVWSEAWTTRAAIGHTELGGGDTERLGELSATWRPLERMRADAGVSHDLVLTRLSLADRIAVTTYVEGADWDLGERFTVRAAFRQRQFSDDNVAHTEALSAACRLYAERRGRISATFGGEQLHTRHDLDDGYYDPAAYLEWGPGVEGEWTPQPPFTLSGEGRLGRQHQRGSPSRAYVNGSFRAQWAIERVATLALELGRSDSDLSTAAGYQQHRWAFSATRGF